MKDLSLRLALTKRDGSLGLRITDAASESPIADVAFTSEQLTDLLAERTITTCGSVLINPATAQLGRVREHATYTPTSEDFDSPHFLTSPSYEMLFFGDLYREHHHWDTATWNRDETGIWRLHLVRWVDTTPHTE